MSRRRKADKRETRPDTLYGDKVLSKFINIVMVNGMKSKSEKIVSKIYFENKEIELQELIKQSLNKL